MPNNSFGERISLASLGIKGNGAGGFRDGGLRSRMKEENPVKLA